MKDLRAQRRATMAKAANRSARRGSKRSCCVMNLRMIGRYALTGLMLSLGGSLAVGQTFVKPGDDGTIEYPIENILPTDGPAEGVKIEARVEPAEFAAHVTTDQAGSTLGPLDIAAQQMQTFVVKYAVDSSAPKGSFNIILHVDMISAGPNPDITDPSADLVTGFSTRPPPPVAPGTTALAQSAGQGGQGLPIRRNS